MTVGSLTSIVIPARDAAKFLPRTFESVLSRPPSRWEALVVDDRSVDATPAIMASYAARDALCCNQIRRRERSLATSAFRTHCLEQHP